jgi:hypothetical protein
MPLPEPLRPCRALPIHLVQARCVLKVKVIPRNLPMPPGAPAGAAPSVMRVDQVPRAGGQDQAGADQPPAAGAAGGEAPPPYFTCPLSRDVMWDPVVLEGNSYERVKLQEHLSSRRTAPSSSECAWASGLLDCRMLDDWGSQHPIPGMLATLMLSSCS